MFVNCYIDRRATAQSRACLPGRRAGASYADVAGLIALINAALVLLAMLALVRLLPVWSMIALAVVLTAMALWRLHHWPGRQGGLDW